MEKNLSWFPSCTLHYPHDPMPSKSQGTHAKWVAPSAQSNAKWDTPFTRSNDIGRTIHTFQCHVSYTIPTNRCQKSRTTQFPHNLKHNLITKVSYHPNNLMPKKFWLLTSHIPSTQFDGRKLLPFAWSAK